MTRPACASARRGLAYYRAKAAEWRARMGAAVPPREALQAAIQRDLPGRCPRYLARLWRAKARSARAAYETWFRRTYEKWRCIHEHEGAWTSNTGNGYYGGLQMTVWFQRTYGPEFYARWGTADRWPVWAQLVAAERAWRGTGFRQWGTAGRCGLA